MLPMGYNIISREYMALSLLSSLGGGMMIFSWSCYYVSSRQNFEVLG